MSYPMEILGDYIDVVSGFAFKSKDFIKNGIPIIKIKNLNENNVSLNSDSYVSKEFLYTHKKYLLNYNDVLIAMTGSHVNQWASVVGRVAKVRYHEDSFLNQRVGKIVVLNPDKCNIDYVYYFLSQEFVIIELAGIASGAANQANIGPTNIKSLKIPFPDITIQHRIANILSAYDDLIENNQKQIKLLEEAAQRLYKEWFVDLRFPGYEDTKIVDGMPEGWRYTELSEIALLKAGGDKPKAFSDHYSNRFKIPIYSNGLSQKGLYGYTDNAEITDESVTISARGTIGYVCLRRTPYVPIVRLISVIPNSSDINVIYLYLYLSNQKFRSIGAAQQQITIPLLKNKTVLIPSKSIVDKFYIISKIFFDEIDLLENKISFLKEARDRLLPKLMNGELEV